MNHTRINATINSKAKKSANRNGSLSLLPRVKTLNELDHTLNYHFLAFNNLALIFRT